MQSLREQDRVAPRAKFLPRGYLYSTAEDFRRTAERLMKDAGEATEEQAKVLRETASRLVQDSERLEAQGDVAPSDDLEALPFA